MGFFDYLFGGKKSNPAEAAMPYLNQIGQSASPYFQPYVNYGQQALPQLQGQYNSLLNSPGQKLNEIGKDFQQSPGFKFAMDQALGALGAKQNAEGMAGSPQHGQYAAELATNLANQEYNNWLGQATGLYGQGLAGEQGMSNQGLQAGGSLADMIANQLQQQSNMAFRGKQEQNAQYGGLLGGLGKLGGAALGYWAGGPLGAFKGWQGG